METIFIKNYLTETFNLTLDSKVLELTFKDSKNMKDHLNVQYTSIDISKLENIKQNFPDNNFDLVFTIATTQYWRDLKNANEILLEMERMSKEWMFLGTVYLNKIMEKRDDFYYYPKNYFLMNGWMIEGGEGLVVNFLKKKIYE